MDNASPTRDHPDTATDPGDLSLPSAPPSPPPTDSGAGERGSLTIRTKVAQRLAVRAALDTPGVLVHAAGLDKFTGRDLPRARVVISANRVRAHLFLAVSWPQSIPQVARAVQHNVADALSDYAGLHVDGIDIAVDHVVVRGDDAVTRSVQ
ncbi:Asp23/Gls24 family envelope stress response protein [Speluncibacter jeojiensis]|uniref:Asp23/Gls24 family envelope stress response protein n=1 Tax=Speluncibacter jeojiensis TaxID=2710754 RepID=A0A9X4M1Y2_9ACTN|nr:Asp23/Gls24 family envelope stress response protein [Corynebacteriales bacterium D3-21]